MSPDCTCRTNQTPNHVPCAWLEKMGHWELCNISNCTTRLCCHMDLDRLACQATRVTLLQLGCVALSLVLLNWLLQNANNFYCCINYGLIFCLSPFFNIASKMERHLNVIYQRGLWTDDPKLTQIKFCMWISNNIYTLFILLFTFNYPFNTKKT